MSSLTLIAPPSSDPVSLAEANAQCRVTSSDEDGLMAGYLLAARQACEDFTGRVFSTQTWEMKLDNGWPTVFDRPSVSRRTRIVLPNPPAQSIVSIAYIDSTGALQTLNPTQYSFSKGDIFGIIDQAYGVSWPTVRCQLEAITVRFVAGYGGNPSGLPEPIRQAILLLVAHFYAYRTAVVADVRVTPAELPMGVKFLLQSYVTEGWP